MDWLPFDEYIDCCSIAMALLLATSCWLYGNQHNFTTRVMRTSPSSSINRSVSPSQGLHAPVIANLA